MTFHSLLIGTLWQAAFNQSLILLFDRCIYHSNKPSSVGPLASKHSPFPLRPPTSVPFLCSSTIQRFTKIHPRIPAFLLSPTYARNEEFRAKYDASTLTTLETSFHQDKMYPHLLACSRLRKNLLIFFIYKYFMILLYERNWLDLHQFNLFNRCSVH